MDLLDRFSRHFGLGDLRSDPASLFRIVDQFAQLPYENLSKIIKHDHTGGASERAKRRPAEVIEGFIRDGSGGTCFSLTEALRHLLQLAGVSTQAILADRHYGQDTHCALVVTIEGQACLIDPGFLICRPLPLDGRVQEIETSFNRIRLVPEDDGRRVHLHTLQQGGNIRRLTFKWPPADDAEFHRAWDNSFAWDMMRYPILASASAAGQRYLQGLRFQRRDASDCHKSAIEPQALVERVHSEFGIERDLVAKALSILDKQGETLE